MENVYLREVVVDGAAEIKIHDYIILLLSNGMKLDIRHMFILC